jgi:hypothetical protein
MQWQPSTPSPPLAHSFPSSQLSLSHTKETHLGRWRKWIMGGYSKRRRMGSHRIPLARLDGWRDGWMEKASRPRFMITTSFTICNVPSYETNTQMTFCLGIPKWESRNSQGWDFRDFGGP